MKKWLIAILVGVLFTLGACNSDTDETSTETQEPGIAEVDDEVVVDADEMETILKESCLSCHSGDYALHAGETDMSVEEIEDLIVNGIGTMPAIHEVSSEEAHALATYLAKK